MTHVGAVYSIVKLDVRGIRREHVALATVALSMLGTFTITALGAFQDRLPGWSAWFPFMVAVSLVGGPGGFGFLFGLLMVDEGDTGVRQALAVSPLQPTLLILTRTVVATAWMCVWPLASVYLMNWTWEAIDLRLLHWLAIVGPLALLTPALSLVIPTLANDKVGALAVFKGLSFVTLIPLALYFVSGNVWYRPLFLVSPTGWMVETYQTFLDHRTLSGYRWALGGAVYAIVLLAVVVRLFRRSVYRLHDRVYGAYSPSAARLMSERTPSSVLDEYLVVQSQLGDSVAFTHLVERWHPSLLRYAYHFTQDGEAARDVAQESWMAVVRGLRSLRDPARFRAWALRIVANKARDWVRREQARRVATRHAEVAATNGTSTPANDAIQRVRAGLGELEPNQRLVLTWFYVEEMSVREIADALSVPVGTVKSRLFHARNALRTRLEET